MMNKLKPILAEKQREVAELRQHVADNPLHPINRLLQGKLSMSPAFAFKQALISPSLAVIAEIKRKSPSKGQLASILDPVELAQHYVAGGANALSILTDKVFFDGTIEDLACVAKKVSIPILRKDFIIDELQIAEAAVAGASAVLCIVAVLGTKTKRLLEFSHALGLDVLVEIHDEEELNIALDSGADIIGINNRNLNTFVVNTECSLALVGKIPNTIVKVAESGITEPALAHHYRRAGFNAVLIGEALVKSSHPEQFIRACQHDD
jgi:indole-3-glycerol phosphate synthase